MHTLFTIVFWLQIRPPPGFLPIAVKQEPMDEDLPGATPTSEPAATGGMQGEVAPGGSHPTQEEPDHKTTTPAPGVSGLGYFTLFLPCTVQCKHC